MTGGRCRVAPVIAAKTSQPDYLPRCHLEQNLTPTFSHEGTQCDRFRFKRAAESFGLDIQPDVVQNALVSTSGLPIRGSSLL
jgi:hypothetical protein